MLRTAIDFFVLILVAGLGSALLGGVFGSLVGELSPQLIEDLFATDCGEISKPGRYGLAVGTICGLFLGTGVAGFACLLSVVLRVLRFRVDHAGVVDDSEG